MLSNGMREMRTTLIQETVPKASRLTPKKTPRSSGITRGKNKRAPLKAVGDAVALGGTSILICGALIRAANSGGQSSTPLPWVRFASVPQDSCFDLAAWRARISLSCPLIRCWLRAHVEQARVYYFETKGHVCKRVPATSRAQGDGNPTEMHQRCRMGATNVYFTFF